MQAPLQAKPNYTNVMRYCPRLVMTRRSMNHSGENRIQKTQCIPSRCLTTAPLPFCVIRAELDEAAAPVGWTFLYCNDALAALEGYPKDKLLGQRFFQLFPDGDRKWLKPYYEAAYEKRAAAFDSISEEIGQYLHELMANPVYNSSVTLRRLKALRKQDGTVDFECVINNRKGHSASLVVHTEVVSPQGERVAYTTFMDALENKSLRNEKGILNAALQGLCDRSPVRPAIRQRRPAEYRPRSAEPAGGGRLSPFADGQQLQRDS